MRFAHLLFFIGFLSGQFTFAQKSENPISVLPTTNIFEKFQKDTYYLNAKMSEIDFLSNQIQTSFSKAAKKDSLIILNHCIKIQNSIEDFTNFNSRHLIEIDNELTGNQPIRGSEITYLNKSFQVYKKYIKLYKLFQKQIKGIPNKNKFNIRSNTILKIKINQLSAFYKNYYKVIGNKRLRRILNASDAVYDKRDNDLKRIALKNLKRKNYKELKKEILRHSNLPTNCVLLDTSVYHQIKTKTYRESRIRQDRKNIKKYFHQDNSYKIGQFFTHYVSGAIGNFAGMFRFRKGYLYKNDSVSKQILNHLNPMDLVAEKTGFALTDKMIPGHFGHIAIWLGTEEQLKKMNLWDHSVIKPIQAKIRAGFTILETDRGGTHLKRLRDFMNVDALAIARIIEFEEFSQDDKVSLYQNALAQIGKEYDFNFDVETSNKLVCSELLYQVFGAIHWPTDRFLKRTTISPDNVLSLALYQNTPIALSYYISAQNRHKINSKSLNDLATVLGYKKIDNSFVLPETKCVKKSIETNKKSKKKCTRVYHKLIYQ